MASDEEIARQVRQREQQWPGAGGDPAQDDLQAYKETAGEIHDELARRIRDVDDRTASEADLSDVVEQLDRLEARLDDLEARLD